MIRPVPVLQAQAMVAPSSWARCVLLLAWVGGCSTEEPTDAAATPTLPAQPGARAGGLESQCVVGDAVDPYLRKSISTQAVSLLRSLREGKDDALWDELHPQARHDDQRKAFLGALASMRERLAATGNVLIERVDIVNLRGGGNSLAVIECGEKKDPKRFTFMTNAGGEDVAIVTLRSDSRGTSFATTIQLRKRGEDWRLLGLHASPSTYRGRDAAAYESMADAAMGRQRVVAAHMLLGVAKLLSDRGASVKTDIHDRVTQKLASIERDQLFLAETATWSLGDARFNIQSLSLVATADGVSPVFEYISPQGLVKDLLDRDADMLIAEVRRRFPDLAKHFDTVVFEAYAEVPNEPGQSYQAYRVVRFLDPSKRRG